MTTPHSTHAGSWNLKPNLTIVKLVCTHFVNS